jgi:hypothetical protein
MDMQDKPVEATAKTAKKAYTPPRLESFGQMRQVTHGVSAQNVDNGGKRLPS